jgi:predicted phage baseplate assembly protein
MPRRDLLASDRFEAHFVVETEDDAQAYLRFAAEGDDHGLPPPVERDRDPDQQPTLVATYRIGNGRAGNVGADAISHVVVPDPGSLDGVTRVRNPLPARGGIDPESTERVRLDAPQAFRVQQRAVTEQDYADVAARHPQVNRAVATRRWTGSWHTMFLTVDRTGGRPVDDGFEAELADFLSQFRLAGHDLEIEPPQFVPVEIVMTVCVAPGYFAEDVRLALLEAFSVRERPDGTRGFFHPDNFTFGDPVYVSKVIATAMQVPGVMWVDVTDRGEGPNRFRRFGEESRGEWERGRIDVERLEIVQLDSDPNAPENGRIEFLMEGGA